MLARMMFAIVHRKARKGLVEPPPVGESSEESPEMAGAPHGLTR
jgi:hypothetical protein